MKHLLPLSILLTLLSCGEDRSSERPFRPRVATHEATQDSTSVTLSGTILSSPNSRLRTCGFRYGTNRQNLNTTLTQSEVTMSFSVTIDSLSTGTYFFTAYATNGLGTSYGDTLSFIVP